MCVCVSYYGCRLYSLHYCREYKVQFNNGYHFIDDDLGLEGKSTMVSYRKERKCNVLCNADGEIRVERTAFVIVVKQ